MYRGETYLVLNQDGIESDVYYTSSLTRCNVPFIVNNKSIPFVMPTPRLTTTGSFIRQIAGSITIMTGDSTDARKMKINDSYVCGGRLWKVSNAMFLDGIYYVYLEIDLESTEDMIVWTLPERLDMYEETVYTNTFYAMRGSAIDLDARLTYSSSDPTVATIDANGTVTLLAIGNVQFTAVWAAKGITETVSCYVVDSSEDPEAQFRCVITFSGLLPQIKVGGGRKKLTATFYDYDGNPAEFQTGGTWDYVLSRDGVHWTTDGTELFRFHTHDTSPLAYNENEAGISLPDGSQEQQLIGSSVKVTYTAPSGVSGMLILDVVGL